MQGVLLFTSTTLAVAGLQSLRKGAVSKEGLSFIPFESASPESTLVVDCTHPRCRQLTHHLKLPGQRELHLDTVKFGGDSSTEQVLLAIKSSSLAPFATVSSNHWDVDSFLSCWSCINPQLALLHHDVIREAARIGDFRELWLGGDADDSTSEASFRALSLVCWLNSEERRLFYKPFESSISRAGGEEDSDGKWQYFLLLFAEVVADPAKFCDQWQDEYLRVLQEYNMLHGGIERALCKIETFPDISLVCVRGDCEPLHYYSLFSPSRGFDVVLSMWQGNRYELEIKYTTYITLTSRPSLPRVELEALAKKLNAYEKETQGGDVKWFANRITDSGPILRLDSASKHLSKAERYGHPFERPIHPSSIDPDVFLATVVDYLRYALSDSTPKKDWSWPELHSFNQKTDWSAWQKDLKSS